MSSGLKTKYDYQIGLDQAWHGKTRVVEKLTRDESFPDIIRVPLSFELDGVTTKLPADYTDRWALVSLDNNVPIGRPVGDSYHHFTPRDAWNWITDILAGTDFEVESAGMLWRRTNWFVSMKLKELANVSPAGFKSTLGFFGGLDKSMSPVCNLSMTRVVCANTLALAMETGDTLFSAKLTKNFTGKLDDAKSEVEKAIGMSAVFNKTLAKLESTPATVEEARQVYAGEIVTNGGDLKATRSQNQLDDLTVLFQRGLGNKGETRADVLNGFTQLFTRGPGDLRPSKKDNFELFQTSEYGAYANRKTGFLKAISTDTGYRGLKSTGRQMMVKAGI